jgi:hypothetical protein
VTNNLPILSVLWARRVLWVTQGYREFKFFE